MALTDKQSLVKWDRFIQNLKRTTYVLPETEGEKVARIKKLEKDPEKWFMYYFPNYCTSQPAPFHKRATKRLVANKKWYEVRAWARELAKSSRAMMELLYLILVKKEHTNILYVSHNKDNAIDLMKPMMLTLEYNQRIVNDYGIQKGVSNWSEENFITRNGISFRAIGAGQNPRGTRNEAARPDFLMIDDIDSDSICRNPDMVKKRWDWVEQALIPTVSVSGDFRILFNGNIIADYSIITEAIKKAKHSEVINIRDKNGKSNWARNTEADIDFMLSIISFIAGQKEYFNNPITEGTVFDKMVYGKCPPLRSLKFVVAYGDPSYTKSKNSDYKAVVLIGELNGKYYIYKAFVKQTSVPKMIKWYYILDDFVGGKTAIYHYVEGNGLQSVFVSEIFRPALAEVAKSEGRLLQISTDNRDKPEKFFRIESGLEPTHSNGNLIFNIDEAHNPHMQTLDEQFTSITPKLKAPDDGPDATEGGKWVIDNKLSKMEPVKVVSSTRNKYKY